MTTMAAAGATSTTSHPLDTFREDWVKAKETKDPNAPFCTLVTVATTTSKDSTAAVVPAARIVGLREVRKDNDGHGILLFINGTSPKWSQLQVNSNYEVLVFWPTLMIQYRISGHKYKTLSNDEMQVHAARRPHTSKLLSHFYHTHQGQSTEMPSRETFVNSMQQLKEQYPAKEEQTDGSEKQTLGGDEIGLVLQPNSIEEWRGSVTDRLHHRYRHDQMEDGSTWTTTTLVP